MKTCPYCGKSEELPSRPFIGSFCLDCYSQNRQIYEIRKPLAVDRCARCKRLRLNGKWEEGTDAGMAELIGGRMRSQFKFKVKPVQIDEEKNKALVSLVATFEVAPGAKVEKHISQYVDVSVTTCEECSRRSSGYFESIIQLRGPENKVEREAKYLLQLVEKFGSFVAKVEVLKEGIDLYVGNDRAAKLAMTQGEMAWTHSAKLAGMREGKKLLRRSYCVRL